MGRSAERVGGENGGEIHSAWKVIIMIFKFTFLLLNIM